MYSQLLCAQTENCLNYTCKEFNDYENVFQDLVGIKPGNHTNYGDKVLTF
jgi:hypothetical protein